MIILFVFIVLVYLAISVWMLNGMIDSCSWEPEDSFFIRNVDTWKFKPLFKKIIIIMLNLFVLPWLIVIRIVDAFNGLFE